MGLGTIPVSSAQEAVPSREDKQETTTQGQVAVAGSGLRMAELTLPPWSCFLLSTRETMRESWVTARTGGDSTCRD